MGIFEELNWLGFGNQQVVTQKALNHPKGASKNFQPTTWQLSEYFYNYRINFKTTGTEPRARQSMIVVMKMVRQAGKIQRAHVQRAYRLNAPRTTGCALRKSLSGVISGC